MKLSNLTKKMTLVIGTLCLIFITASAVYYRSLLCLPFIFGALLGSAISVAKVILLEKTIDKALKMEEKAAGGYVQLQHILRLLLTGAVLMLGALVPGISLWGVAAGIFTFQISIYVLKFLKVS